LVSPFEPESTEEIVAVPVPTVMVLAVAFAPERLTVPEETV
jgi:hypothetical protein